MNAQEARKHGLRVFNPDQLASERFRIASAIADEVLKKDTKDTAIALERFLQGDSNLKFETVEHAKELLVLFLERMK